MLGVESEAVEIAGLKALTPLMSANTFWISMVPGGRRRSRAAGTTGGDLKDAEQDNRDALLVGKRRHFIDDVNGERGKTWGELSEIRHRRKDLNLPRNFPDQPFRPSRRKSKTLDEQIADTKNRLKTLEVKKAEKALQVEQKTSSETSDKAA